MQAKQILCDRAYSQQILEILNEAIASSTAIWDYKPRTATMMDVWFDVKQAGTFPIVGFVDANDSLLAFGTYGTFRAWPAYKYTVEHSVYVARAHRGRGLGRAVLGSLVQHATLQGYHNLIGGIEARNTASIALHEKCGFQFCGTIRQAGFKFGEWLDLMFFQRLLDAPDVPADDPIDR